MATKDLMEALIALKADGFQLGPTWDRAHRLAQANEGEPAFDQLHALLHRIENDTTNAAYWYRRAGEPVFDGDLESECELILKRWSA